jgi:hypothetical protein
MAGLLKSRWLWLIAALLLSYLLSKQMGGLFLFLPLLGFLPFKFGGGARQMPQSKDTPTITPNIKLDSGPKAASPRIASPNEQLIETLVTRYNARDAQGVAALFAPGCQEFSHGGELLRTGPQAIADNYTKVFAEFPHNHAEVLHRSAFGDKVIDHERVRRSPTSEPFEVIVIYTIKDGAVIRTDYVK